MNTARYKNNGNSKYPVSTDTLDFIQEQIKLIYNLSDLYGKNFIVRRQTANADGIIVIAGEVMPLKAGSENSYIAVREENVTVTAAGVDFENARTIRYAEYTSVQEGDCYEASEFELMKTIEDLQEELLEAKMHHQPKFSISTIYGNVDCNSLQYGWVPCGFFGLPVQEGDSEAAFQAEKNKWIARYGAGVSFEESYIPDASIAFLRVSKVVINSETINIPDLSERFVVNAGKAYQLGETGGKDSVKLTAAESGLPKHKHDFKYNSYRGTTADGVNRFARAGNNHEIYTVETQESGGTAAEQAHENRPPYFALNMIMKVI